MQPSRSFSTEEGMQMDESDEQDANVPRSMHETREPDSKITLAIVSQRAKHPLVNV
jgi:hypothetical protein